MYDIENIDGIRMMMLKNSNLSIVCLNNSNTSIKEFFLYINKKKGTLDLREEVPEDDTELDFVGWVSLRGLIIEELAKGPDELIKAYINMCYGEIRR